MDIFLSGLFIFLYVLIGIYFLWCFIAIAKKAGYSTFFGFLLIIPIINFIALGILAFEKWPLLIRLEKNKLEIKESPKKEALEIVQSKELCPKCNQQLEINKTFCPQCGVNVIEFKSIAGPKLCPKCGGKVKSKDVFCSSCGFNIKELLNSKTENVLVESDEQNTSNSKQSSYNPWLFFSIVLIFIVALVVFVIISGN
jgi:hypothetical protein